MIGKLALGMKVLMVKSLHVKSRKKQQDRQEPAECAQSRWTGTVADEDLERQEGPVTCCAPVGGSTTAVGCEWMQRRTAPQCQPALAVAGLG